jgi:hypothetical protein
MVLIGNMMRRMHKNTDITKQDETKNMNTEVIKDFQLLSIVNQLHF